MTNEIVNSNFSKVRETFVRVHNSRFNSYEETEKREEIEFIFSPLFFV